MPKIMPGTFERVRQLLTSSRNRTRATLKYWIFMKKVLLNDDLRGFSYSEE